MDFCRESRQCPESGHRRDFPPDYFRTNFTLGFIRFSFFVFSQPEVLQRSQLEALTERIRAAAPTEALYQGASVPLILSIAAMSWEPEMEGFGCDGGSGPTDWGEPDMDEMGMLFELEEQLPLRFPL